MKTMFALVLCLCAVCLLPATALSGTCPGGLDEWCWGQPVELLPESEWQPYVGRPSAFLGKPDPARMPVLSGSRTPVRSTPRKPVAAKPKIDPCEERIWKAFDDAAKAGKIPAAAVPPQPGCPDPAPSASQPAAATAAIPAPVVPAPSIPPAASTSPGISAIPQMTPPVNANQPNEAGGVYTPYSSNVAVPGTSAHGMPTPNPSLANNPVAAN